MKKDLTSLDVYKSFLVKSAGLGSDPQVLRAHPFDVACHLLGRRGRHRTQGG